MRYHEIVGGLRLPVSAEEQEILNKVGKGVKEDEIGDERAAEVARTMITRGILNKAVDQTGKVVYRPNGLGDTPVERD